MVIALLGLMSVVAAAQSYYVDYFANNGGVGAADQLIRIINVGTGGTPLSSPTGDVCANLYVFDSHQVMIACCACRVTPDGYFSAFVGTQLTNNPLTGALAADGVINVATTPATGSICDPTTSLANASTDLAHMFATHLQMSGGGMFVTESEPLPSPLSASEEGFLSQACLFTRYLGSGAGTCSCSVPAVFSTMGITPSPISVSAGDTSMATLRLSTPAPAAGLTIALKMDNTLYAVGPAVAIVPAGQTSVSIPVTGVAAGDTTLHATAPGLPEATAGIHVNPLTITFIPNPISVSAFITVTATLQLSAPAPAAGLPITLKMDNTAYAVAPATVTVPGGQTTALIPVAGVAPGSTILHATAPGTPEATTGIQVTPATIAITPNPISVSAFSTVTATLQLSAPAPVAGLAITLKMDNSAYAVAPATIILPAGQTSIAFSITGVAPGDTILHATAPGTMEGTAGVHVTPATIAIIPSPISVSAFNTFTASLQLSGPAPIAGLPITLQIDNTAYAVAPATVVLPAGQTSVSIQVTGVAPGDTILHATAPGTTEATAGIHVTPAAMAITPNPVNVYVGDTITATLQLSAAAPSAGLIVTLKMDNTAYAVVPATVTVPAGQTSVLIAVTGIVPGGTILHATAPGITEATAGIQVTALNIAISPNPISVSVGNTASVTLQLSGPAPSGGFTINLKVGNTALVTPQIHITAGLNSGTVSVTGVAPGETTLRATIPGIAKASAPVLVIQ